MKFAISTVLALAFSLSAWSCPLPQGKKISLTMKDVKVADALAYIFKESKVALSLDTNTNVKGVISLQVDDAEVCDVFDFLMSEGQLKYKVLIEHK